MFSWLTFGVLFEGTPASTNFGAGYYRRRKRFMAYTLE